ncbi:MAG: leucine-rich repeat domain-containing protein [Spirochaetaceae bacterium]|jgi:hypothetical protein|nr:leucine-rich repeat domain-containing protein [Spirochaetaceae bacterium]
MSRAVLSLLVGMLFLSCGENPSKSATDEDAIVHTADSLASLADLLAELPGNRQGKPWRVALKNVDLRNLGGGEDGLEPLFRTFQGRFVSLDLDACSGATIGWGRNANQNTEGRPDRDKLTEVILPASALRVGYRNFQNSPSLKSVTFPSGLETIGMAGFQGCTALEMIELPAKVVHIEDSAFENCANLRTVILRGETPPGLGRGRYSPPLPAGEDSGVFSGCAAGFRIIVPAGCKEAYQASSGWSFYADRIAEYEKERQ